MYYARRIQETVCRQKKEDLEVCILFIGHEDYKKLINQFWSISKTEGLILLDTSIQNVFMSASISESTLLYSWGSSMNGKLGTGVRDTKCDEVSGFVREDLSRQASVESELEINDWYTWQP